MVACSEFGTSLFSFDCARIVKALSLLVWRTRERMKECVCLCERDIVGRTDLILANFKKIFPRNNTSCTTATGIENENDYHGIASYESPLLPFGIYTENK